MRRSRGGDGMCAPHTCDELSLTWMDAVSEDLLLPRDLYYGSSVPRL